jgi:1-acyl-sn-glycerol-3-phosphate acyltransferase
MEHLTTRPTYSSPERKISLCTRISPSLSFYSKLSSVLWESYKLAKKGKFTGEKWIHESLKVVRSLESVGVKFEIQNLNAFRTLDSPCVFIGNHMSTLETFVLPCIIHPYRKITFIVKESLTRYPIFKHILTSSNPITVGRKNPWKDLKTVFEQGLERLQQKISVIVFPQTTRIVSPTLERFNTIGIKLARRAGVPVVPFALKTDAWANGTVIKDLGRINPRKRVRIHFDNPLRIKGNGKTEHKHITKFITDKLKTWFKHQEV